MKMDINGFVCYMLDGELVDNDILSSIDVYRKGTKLFPFSTINLCGETITYQMFIRSWIGVEMNDIF